MPAEPEACGVGPGQGCVTSVSLVSRCECPSWCARRAGIPAPCPAGTCQREQHYGQGPRSGHQQPVSCDPEPGGQPRPSVGGQHRSSVLPRWGAGVHFPVIVVLPRSQRGTEVRGMAPTPPERKGAAHPGERGPKQPSRPRSTRHLPAASLNFAALKAFLEAARPAPKHTPAKPWHNDD